MSYRSLPQCSSNGDAWLVFSTRVFPATTLANTVPVPYAPAPASMRKTRPGAIDAEITGR
jgi:hypothetical protein